MFDALVLWDNISSPHNIPCNCANNVNVPDVNISDFNGIFRNVFCVSNTNIIIICVKRRLTCNSDIKLLVQNLPRHEMSDRQLN